MNDTPDKIITLPAPAAPANATPEGTPPTPAEPATPPENVITPFADTGEVVRAYPHKKHEGQFVLADAAGQVFCVCPNVQKAQLVYESVNGYFQAMAMREQMISQRRAENAKQAIDRKLIITP